MGGSPEGGETTLSYKNKVSKDIQAKETWDLTQLATRYKKESRTEVISPYWFSNVSDSFPSKWPTFSSLIEWSGPQLRDD